jgi:hypothetical protein
MIYYIIYFKYYIWFFHNFNFLIRWIIKINIKIKYDKYLEME